MRNTIISLLVMLPLAAFAKGGGSEYFYQASAGKQDVTPRLTIATTETEFDSGSKTEASANVLSAEYEYGWMEGLSVGGALAYTASGDYDNGTSDGDVSGLNNLEAFVKASLPAGPGALKYGAALSLSLEDSEFESNGDTNAATGGHDLEPYVGYEMSSGSCTYGAKLALEVGLTDRTIKDTVGTTADHSGKEDTTISLFYEHKFSEDMLLGASLDWVTTSDSKNEDTGTKTESLSPTQVISVYLPVKLGGGTLLPAIAYGITTDDKVGANDVDSYSALALTVGYRIEL